MNARFTKAALHMAVAALCCCAASVASAQVTVSIDLDPGTPGIQNSVNASASELLTALIVIDVGSAGLSSYGVSAQFDTGELNLNGSLDPTDAGAAASELLPGGFAFNITTGVQAIVEDAGGGNGRVHTFEAATFANGPVGASFIAGEIAFTVMAPAGDPSDIDVIAGEFNTGVDGFFDNDGNPLTPTFIGASIVPEPGMLTLLVLAFWLAPARRR